MADRPIESIVADLRQEDRSWAAYPQWYRVLLVLGDWQRQADEIERLKEIGDICEHCDGSGLQVEHHGPGLNETVGCGWCHGMTAREARDALQAERDAARAEVGALRALVRYWKRYGTSGRSLPKELQAALDRALAEPEAIDAE